MTARQVAFRALAAQAHAGGALLVPDWLAAQHDLDIPLARHVSLEEWQGWVAAEGFAEWFLRGIPQLAAPGRVELAAMDALFLRALTRRVAEGDVRAMAVFGQIRRDQQRTQHLNEALSAWLAGEIDDIESGWNLTEPPDEPDLFLAGPPAEAK